MLRKYQKRLDGKRNYSNYTDDKLEAAVNAVKNNKMSERKASLTFGIPRSTIQNKLNGKHLKNIGGQITFTQHEEELFAIRVMKMCK